jgi:hypothetical protein
MVILGIMFDAQGEVDDARVERALITIFYVAILPSALSFYAFYYFLFPQHLRHKSLLLSAFYGLLIAVGAASIGHDLENNSGAPCDESGKFSSVEIIFFMSFIPLVSGIVALVIHPRTYLITAYFTAVFLQVGHNSPCSITFTMFLKNHFNLVRFF